MLGTVASALPASLGSHQTRNAMSTQTSLHGQGIPPGNQSVTHQSTTTNEQAILAAHASSGSHALIYIVVVLVAYALALIFLMMKYVRRDNNETRLSYIYDELVRRDHRMRGTKSQEIVHLPVISPATCSQAPEPERLLVLQNTTPV
uniref:Uncharacterized protein n=1 Tax=Strigamia maritima TaxID=126957 RepID=T1J9V3_STRMM